MPGNGGVGYTVHLWRVFNAYPCQPNEYTPDEAVFALFPDWHPESGICGKPVHPDQDIRGREA